MDSTATPGSARHEHLAQLVLERVSASPRGVAFRVRRGGAYADVTWSEVAPRLEAIAAGLLSAASLDDGACVTITGSTSLDWVIADLAALTAGLRTVPIYASLLPEEVGYMHADTGAQLAIVENGVQLEKVRTMRRGFTFFDTRYAPERVTLRGKIVVVDPSGVAPAPDWESLGDLEARGRERLPALRSELERRRGALRRDDVATLTYTSGTTGPPKAVVQTHGNMLSMLESAARTGVFDTRTREAGLFLFLPLAHSFGRLVELAGPFFDSALVISSVPTLAEDLALSRPGFFPGAPRVFEKMMGKVLGAVEAGSPVKRALARWALETGREAARLRLEGRRPPPALALRLAVADRLVLGKVRAKLGLDRASVLLSGSAPLRSDVHEFFLGLGLTLVEAYGLTETCPGLTTNRPERIRVGTVGQAFDCVTLRIAEDGEVLAKGPNIVSGYLNRADATRDAFDDEGWFHTGDLGSLDADGFLRITGRKKELIKTSGGKFVAPVKIEARLKAHPIVQEAVVIGDGRNYCTALFALDPELLGELARREGFPADPAHPRVRAVLEGVVAATNATLASYETIKAFRVAPGPFTVDGGELTASLKVKRRTVAEKYAALIESMYAHEAERSLAS